MKYPRIIIAGTNSGVGKTTLTLGIISALEKRGLKVQPFKAGPDYIDSSYHTLVSRRNCRNLDTWMLSKDVVLELFERQAKLCDISIIEGVMGLYDGVSDKEEGSSAHLAKILKSPVIIVVDAASLSRSAAAVVLGYKEFDRGVDLKGAILNNIGSPSHYRSVKYAIRNNVGLPVLGFLPKDKRLILPERHLGLIPAQEKKPLDAFLKRATELVENNIDINAVVAISRNSQPLPFFRKRLFAKEPHLLKTNITVAKDTAFNFYYQDNLDILRHYGANIIEFSPIEDKNLPRGCDGLYIGGGFPELFAKQLSKNTGLKNDIIKRARQGMPVYAECGGLMYLMKNIVDFRNRNFPMAGIFNFSAKMAKSLAALGYVNIEAIRNNILTDKGDRIRGHVFHWSYLRGEPKKTEFAYRVKKKGRDTISDGLLRWNVLASYAHLHFGSNLRFAKNFIDNCSIYAKKKH